MASHFTRFSEWFSQRSPVTKGLLVVVGAGFGVVTGVVLAPVVGAAASALGLGAAGGTLTGAAASSAGLAALGGGSVAAGGLGMVGGTTVVASAGGVGFAGATAYTTHKVSQSGTEDIMRVARARATTVDGDDIRFEEG